MLVVNYLRQNLDAAKKLLAKRPGLDVALVDQIIQLDDERKAIQHQLDETLAEMNKASKEIGMLFKSGQREEANALKTKTGDLKQRIKDLEEQHRAVEEKLHEVLVTVPNIPNELVPIGKSDTENEFIRSGGPAAEKNERALPHWDIAKKYGIIDLDYGIKITGAGFPVFVDKGARLQRALINYFLDQAREAGYTEFIPPLLVNEDTAFCTGQLPDKEGQMYHARDDNFFLVPTAEVPLTNIYRDVIVKEEDFPIKLTAYTPCFRREAGSYGKDVRGLNRVHQFDKVEVVQIEHPDRSYETLDKMVEQVEQLLKNLGLPYRIVRLCTGDLGFTSAMTYDFEVYSAAQDKWLEVSSVSNFETFQSNRLKLRFKKDGKTHLAHTLNGSALALPRIVAALLENNQTEDGIAIPEVLRSYTGFDKIG